MKNNKKIADFFEKGEIPDSGGILPKHIITVVSDVFVFDKKVYKIYKSDSEFFNTNFNDLSNKDNRFAFTRNDFEWNNRLTPEVYTKLSGVVLADNNLRFIDPTDEAQELVIEMNKVDMAKQLIKLLFENRISLKDCFEIGLQLGKRLLSLPKLEQKHTLYEDFIARYNDIGPWIGSVKAISTDKVQKYTKYVKDFIETHKREFSFTELMDTCIDIHADNAVFIDNIFLPIDIYAPKEAWLHGYKFLNLYRIATDIYGFLGKDGFNKVLEGYQSFTKIELPRKYDKFLITYCELINWPYQYMLAEKESWRLEVANKYENVLKEIFANS